MFRRLAWLSLLFVISAATALAADVTGRWNVKISTHDEEIVGVASFTQTGDQVKGWLGPSEEQKIPITMSLKGDMLTIWTHPQPGRKVAFSRCDVTVSADRMSGTIDSDKGTIEFVRSKEP
jgi:hypothetical protein